MGRLRFLWAVAALLLVPLFAAPAQAELGDYSAWRTFLHLLFPPRADNPVTPGERLADYPLLANPAGFDDGFRAGDYRRWQTVQLAPQTGAVCGNGSPYKFFVNRVPNTSNMLIYMEGGGACWDYASCTGEGRGARNPDGIPDNYMDLQNPGASLVSPLVFRDHPWSRVKTQNWNLVYVPYCTGDIYGGDRVAAYENPDGGDDLVWHHNGLRNVRAVLSWLRDNLQRPAQLLSSGCSAGGVGSLVNYPHLRADMAPARGYLLNDSGPVFDAPTGGNVAKYPSLPLHNRIREAWGLDGSRGPLEYLQSRIGGLDPGNLGTINRAISSSYGNDRLGHTHFWRDLNYPVYSYADFHPDIAEAPDQRTREALLLARWEKDTERLRAELSSLYNYGYYLPQFRAVNDSHCTTIIEFANSDIQEMGLELDDFIDDLLEGSEGVMEASESSPEADLSKPFNPLYFLLDQFL